MQTEILVQQERDGLDHRWTRGFELFAVGKGVNNLDQKKALLLHSAGPSVQDICYSLVVPDPVDDQNVYDLAVAALDGYFQPQSNAAFERSQFRAMLHQATVTMKSWNSILNLGEMRTLEVTNNHYASSKEITTR